MRIKPASIYFQLLVSFLCIILLTLTVSTLFEYRTYASQLPQLITEIRTKNIAYQLSSAYTDEQSWSSIEYGIEKMINLESLDTIDNAAQRLVIRDIGGKTVFNSFSKITTLESIELLEGESQPIIDLTSMETVGVVTMYISKQYVSFHSQRYASTLLKSGIYKALIIAAIAFILSIILSRYITGPVIRLTEAVHKIAEDGTSKPLTISSSNEIGKLGTAFNRMLSSLHAQRESRKRLIADVSHEINTPLNSIRLEARALTDGLVSAEEAGQRIISEIDTLANIIYDLDWIARTDSGEFYLNMEKYQLSDLVDSEVSRWKHKAEAYGLHLVKQPPAEELPAAMIDVIRMTTVLGNLIDNAVKYSPEGSTITVHPRFFSGSIEISVRDDGPAIPPEHRESVFDRFYRAENNSSPNRRGRGLGLSIVKQIVDLHGGSIRLECGEHHGNSFIFTVPV